ncbi:MAG: helix-turn-helix domain-containing protein [Lachnospiraceae bacterium]|nr:helix-turn-helix domain-containing protein [Lachnospiraceae bacterium]
MGYPSIDMVATGKRIHELMKANNLSAKAVADFMGFRAPQAVYKWQRGETLPSLDNMYALSLLLHTNMEGILVLVGGGVFML